jgi:hypothetical protein
MARRECCNSECDWVGETDRMLGTVGPLCPDCGEVTELVDVNAPREPTEAMLAAVRNRPHPSRPDGWDSRHATIWRSMWDAFYANPAKIPQR